MLYSHEPNKSSTTALPVNFTIQANVTQTMKRVIRNTPNWQTLPEAQQEAAEAVIQQLGNILSAPIHMQEDAWLQIRWYANQVLETFTEKPKPKQ